MAKPANQSCASCYVWDDEIVVLNVAGYCKRWAPRSGSGGSDFPVKQAGEWCYEGLDATTLIPFNQPAAGASGITVGTFTCSVGASTAVPQIAVTATSTILINPTNAAAITLVTTSRPTITNDPGVGFVVSWTPDAVGTETFGYQVIN